MSAEFLDLEREIDNFASQWREAPYTAGATLRKGLHASLGDQLAVIETKAAVLREKSRRAELMIRIAITVEAFEAIARTLPLGSVSFGKR